MVQKGSLNVTVISGTGIVGGSGQYVVRAIHADDEGCTFPATGPDPVYNAAFPFSFNGDSNLIVFDILDAAAPDGDVLFKTSLNINKAQEASNREWKGTLDVDSGASLDVRMVFIEAPATYAHKLTVTTSYVEISSAEGQPILMTIVLGRDNERETGWKELKQDKTSWVESATFDYENEQFCMVEFTHRDTGDMFGFAKSDLWDGLLVAASMDNKSSFGGELTVLNEQGRKVGSIGIGYFFWNEPDKTEGQQPDPAMGMKMASPEGNPARNKENDRCDDSSRTDPHAESQARSRSKDQPSQTSTSKTSEASPEELGKMQEMCNEADKLAKHASKSADKARRMAEVMKDVASGAGNAPEARALVLEAVEAANDAEREARAAREEADDCRQSARLPEAAEALRACRDVARRSNLDRNETDQVAKKLSTMIADTEAQRAAAAAAECREIAHNASDDAERSGSEEISKLAETARRLARLAKQYATAAAESAGVSRKAENPVASLEQLDQAKKARIDTETCREEIQGLLAQIMDKVSKMEKRRAKKKRLQEQHDADVNRALEKKLSETRKQNNSRNVPLCSYHERSLYTMGHGTNFHAFRAQDKLVDQELEGPLTSTNPFNMCCDVNQFHPNQLSEDEFSVIPTPYLGVVEEGRSMCICCARNPLVAA